MPASPTTQRILDAVQTATARLTASGSATPRLDAEVLLRHVAGWDRTGYFLRRHDPLPPDLGRTFAGLIERRVAGVPVAYLTGSREFRQLPFLVSPAVLVPRPETELLVEWARARIERRPENVVLDLGTGSGAIVLSLASDLDPSRLHRLIGSDISPGALAIARQNQVRLGHHGAVTWVRWVLGNLGEWSAPGVDLVLANLPYLRPDQLADNPELRAEPEAALVAGDDGLALIRPLIADLPRLLAPGGAVGLEIDPSQAEAVGSLLGAALPDRAITVRPDLAGFARHVTAEAPS